MRATFGRHGSGVKLARVGHRGEVGVVGPLADVAGGEAGEAGAVLEQAVEMAGGHELRARLAVHVDELREEELDAGVAHVRADRLQVGRQRCRIRSGEGGADLGGG